MNIIISRVINRLIIRYIELPYLMHCKMKVRLAGHHSFYSRKSQVIFALNLNHMVVLKVGLSLEFG